MSRYQTKYAKLYAAALDRLQAGASPDEVLQYIDSINDEDYRDGTLAKMAWFFAANARFQESIRFCQTLRDPLEHADALFAVGREARKNGNSQPARHAFQKTIEAAEKLNPGAWEVPALFLQVSDELWNLGEEDEALELLGRTVELGKRPPQHFESSKTLAGCARLLSRWGNRSQVLNVAKAIESKEQRNTVLKELENSSRSRPA